VTDRAQGGAGAGLVSADPLPLARALLACASVTPIDAGSQATLAAVLEALGFTVTLLPFGQVPNLFATREGTRPGQHFAFAGHTDVVPPGSGWIRDPFGAVVEDGTLHGRGAVDMKGNIAAFVSSLVRLGRDHPGRISLVITGDEEGQAVDGTVRLVEWLEASNLVPDFALVGEPTSRATLGDTVKIGRRGSLNARIAIQGTQGHTAYPQRADNPLHRLVAALHELTTTPLDQGSDAFEPSTLQLTSIDVGNPVTNVIPAEATARLNIRFNDLHSSGSVGERLRAVVARHARRFLLEFDCSGESFRTQPGAALERLTAAILASTGIAPALDTGGGTSDARFLARICPVAEFGLVGTTMHRNDEAVPVAELDRLAACYQNILQAMLPATAAAA